VGAPVLRSVNETLNGTALTIEFVEKYLIVSRSSTEVFSALNLAMSELSCIQSRSFATQYSLYSFFRF